MEKLKFLYFFVLIFICASCAKDQWVDPPGKVPGNNSPYNLISPKIKIAVVSDIHYLDPSLMPDDYLNNSDFQTAMSGDRKVIELSDPIFRKVLSELSSEKPDIVLILGDLAREGELTSHETVKKFLKQLEKKGPRVYVIPGNNDINNPDAVSFKTSPPTTVPNISPEQFRSIYADFGYNEALYRDDNSLSYICQPCKGLWILGIDANEITPDGKQHVIKTSTMDWILEEMKEARKKNIMVFTMMHYSTIEHYSGQNSLEPLISDSKNNAIALMNAGVRLIFTGHYHATDIVEFSNKGKTLTDIQTGSLVTPPCPYRIMYLDDNFIKIDTKRITSVNAKIPEGFTFLTYCNSVITDRLNSFFYKALRGMFNVPKPEALLAAPVCVNAFKAYISGDERITDAAKQEITDIVPKVPSFKPLESILYNWWTDLPPADNKVHIKLK
jgi:3',5'-cyclic AMP phosphodiesterase CpdA